MGDPRAPAVSPCTSTARLLSFVAMKSSPASFSSRLAFALAAGLLFAAPAARADLDLPRPSPFAKVSQVVGLTEITVDYSSPGVKGRKIWGGLVPYDQMWRAGANTRDQGHLQQGRHLRRQDGPGRHLRVLHHPGQGRDWTVILNKKADQAGTGRDYKAERRSAARDAAPEGGAVPRAAGVPVHRLHRRPGVAGSRVGEAAPFDPDHRRHGEPGAGEHQERRRRHLAHLRERGPLHAREQEGLRRRPEVRRSVAGAEGGLVQPLDQGAAAGREGQLQGRARHGEQAYELGKKDEQLLPRGRDEEGLAEWKKKG